MSLGGPEHTVTGSVVRVGEEVGDVERHLVCGGEVMPECARLSWPDGTAVDLV